MNRSLLITFLFLICVQIQSFAFWSDVLKQEASEKLEKLSDDVIEQLDNVVTLGDHLVEQDVQTLSRFQTLRNTSQKTIHSNNSRLIYEKTKLQQGIKNNASSSVLQQYKKNIQSLQKENNTLKKELLSTQENIAKTNETINNIKPKVQKVSFFTKIGKGIKKVLKYEDAAKSFGSVTGEIAAWQEGNTSFKNVVLKTAQEGLRATFVVGTGAVSGMFSSAIGTPVLGTAIGLAVSNGADAMYKATVGKAFESMMDREHDNINSYKQDPKELERLRAERRKRAYENQKKHLESIGAKQDEYISVLKAYIDQQNAIMKKIEEDAKKSAEEERNRKAKEVPVFTFTPPLSKLKPGETAQITVNVTGGLEPIKISGAVDATINDRYDRSFTFKWTAPEDMKPGNYDFALSATSASGLSSSKQLEITINEEEVVEEQKKPTPQASPTVSNSNFDVQHFKTLKSIKVEVKLAKTHIIINFESLLNADFGDGTISWNGNSFSGQKKEIVSGLGLSLDVKEKDDKITTINGELSEDGLSIKYLEASSKSQTQGSEFFHSSKVVLRNVPFVSQSNSVLFHTKGNDVASIVESIEVTGFSISEAVNQTGIYKYTSREIDANSFIHIQFFNP